MSAALTGEQTEPQIASPVRKIRVERVIAALDIGGAESLLTVHAAEHDRERIELGVSTLGNAGRAAAGVRARGVRVTDLGVDLRIDNPRATVAVIRHLRRVRPDLVHATVPEADFHAAVACRILGIPCLIDEAGIPSRGRLGRAVFTALHRSVAGNVAVSQQLKEHLVRVEHAPADRVTVIPTCADRASFDDPKSGYAIASPIRIACIGRLAEVKNYEVLARAAMVLAQRGREVRIDIAGDGPHRAVLQQVIDAEGAGDRVRLLGFYDDRRGLLRGADLYAIPSWSEGCSLSLIEAMAAAVPVLASRVPGNLEVLGPQLAPWTAPPEDAAAWADLVVRAADLAEEERAALGRRGRELALARFSPASYARSLEDLYVRTLGR